MKNPIDSLKLWLAKRAIKAAGGNLALIPGWMRHAPFFPDFRTLVREAYKGNATVFACQLILALKFPEPSLQAWKQNRRGKLEIIPNHPLRQLLAKPNPDMGEDELMKFVITYCALGGNIYLWKQRNRGQKVLALWPFHDGQMQPIPGRNTDEGLVHYYVMDVGDYTPRDSNPWQLPRHDDLPGIAIPKTEIIHWKWMLDPEYPWRGIGALVASAGDVDLRNELKSFVYSLLKNDATPPFIIKLAEGEEMDEDKAKRLRAEWRQSHSGVNRGSFAILEAGMDAQQMSMNLQQLQIESLQSSPDVAICMGYHIPPGVVGTLVGLQYNTYANAAEAREALTEDTLIPLWRSFASEVQQGMADEAGYGREITIEFEISTVRSLQTNQSELETRLASGLEKGALTRAQYLQGLGYETTPADEVRKVGMTWDWERADMTPEERLAEAMGAGAETGQAGDVAPANIESLAGLNGAQITAALAILEGVRTGTSSPIVAIELLIALGLDEARAKRIVNATPRAEGDTEEIPEDENEPPDNFPPEKRNGHHSPGKGNKAVSPQQRAKLKKQVDALRKVRTSLQGKMETALQKYFDALAGKVESRFESGKSWDYEVIESVTPFVEIKKPKLNTLITKEDEDELEDILKSFTIQIGESSWEILNSILSAEGEEFLRNSPAMRTALGRAGDRVKDILDTTKESLRELLQYGQTQGWSIQDYVNGDETMRGISAIVEETYKDRAEAVARTELGTAQNNVAAQRYKDFGIKHVIIFDNGFPNSHPFCTEVDGQVVELSWYENNPLSHPNCVRSGAPLFDYEGDVFTDEIPFGGKFDGG